MKDDSHLYLAVDQLVRRGWTHGLIKRFLGQPERWLPVNHWANWQGKRAFFLERVQEVEASAGFQEAWDRSLRRRRVPKTRLADFLRERAVNKDAVAQWRNSLSAEDKRIAAGLAKVSAIFEEARRRGYRTPHKA
jgi:hypothetical protein